MSPVPPRTDSPVDIKPIPYHQQNVYSRQQPYSLPLQPYFVGQSQGFSPVMGNSGQLLPTWRGGDYGGNIGGGSMNASYMGIPPISYGANYLRQDY